MGVLVHRQSFHLLVLRLYGQADAGNPTDLSHGGTMPA
jgi:hypothetical protein